MKKTTKSLLITALILFCAGLLLALCATLYAKIAGIDVYDVDKKAKTIQSISVDLDTILSSSPDSNYVKKLSDTAFSEVEIHSFAGDVEVCVGGEKTELLLDKTNTGNLSYRISGDTLIVEEVDPVCFLGFSIDKGGLSFAGLRHLFRPGNAVNFGKTVTLKLGKDVDLAGLEIDSTVGDVTVRDVASDNIRIKSGNGDVVLSGLKNSEGKIAVQGSKTDVKLDRCHYVSCSVSTRFGNIRASLIESTVQSTVLDLWVGDVTAHSELPASYYKLSLSTALGKIRKNGESFEKKLTQDGSSAVRISSGIFLGDFTLNFTGKEEKDLQPPVKPEETETAENAASQTQNAAEG